MIDQKTFNAIVESLISEMDNHEHNEDDCIFCEHVKMFHKSLALRDEIAPRINLFALAPDTEEGAGNIRICLTFYYFLGMKVKQAEIDKLTLLEELGEM